MKIFLLTLLILGTISCSTQNLKTKKLVLQKKQPNTPALKTPKKKVSYKIPVKKYKIDSFDSENIYIHIGDIESSSKHPDPKEAPSKLYVFRDEEYQEAVFVDVFHEIVEDCENSIRYFWRYKFKQNHGRPIGGNFAISSSSIEFIPKKNIPSGVVDSEETACTVNSYDDLLVKNCAQGASLNYRGKEIYQSVKTDDLEKSIIFFGKAHLNDSLYFYIDSTYSIQHSYELVSANGKLLQGLEVPKKECIAPTVAQDPSRQSVIVETSFDPPPAKPEAYEIFGSSGQFLAIDSNERGYEGELQVGDPRYKKLFIIGDSGVSEVNYVDTIDEEINVCDEPLQRRLWRYEGASGDIALTAKNVESESFDRSTFIAKPLDEKQKDLIRSRLLKSDWDPTTKSHASEIEKRCNRLVSGLFEEVNCDWESYFIVAGKTLTTSSTDGYGTPTVKLQMILKINGKKYYLIRTSVKGGSGYSLVSEDGEYIYVKPGDRPTMC